MVTRTYRIIQSVVALVGLTGTLLGQPDPSTVVLNSNGASVELLYPSHQIQKSRYSCLIVIAPGGSRSSAKMVWKPVADALGYMLVIPSINVSNTSDAAQVIVATRALVDRTVKIDTLTSVLVGMNDSGALAIRAGLEHPKKFPNTLAFFSYPSREIDPKFHKNIRTGEYDASHFILVTGDGNPEQQSMVRFNGLLKDAKIQSLLIVYPDLIDTFPTDLTALMGRVKRTIEESPKKEMIK
ncbi:hypothetical protein EB093_04645 [bacterium]|nr:hypothetical protein [bacterium]